MILEKIVVGPMQANCYIVACASTGEAIVIDPGAEPEKILTAIKKHHCELNFVVNTHGHIDHIGANAGLAAPVYIHRLDADFLNNPQLNLSSILGQVIGSPQAAGLLEDGQKLKVGSICLEVIHTPGHTPGSICLKADQSCFTGDTLFAQGVGRTDFSYASEANLLNSIRTKLIPLGKEITIYPGHGPASNIGLEIGSNPFI